MTTVLSIITEAAKDAGIAATDIPLESEYFDMGLIRLNQMLKAWQNEAITIWKNTAASITVTDGTASYAIAARPLMLDVVSYKTNGLETPMLELSRQEYLELPDKVSAGTPSQYFYDRGQLSGTLYVWPVLTTGAGTIEWSGKVAITTATSPSDVLEVPAEWDEAVHYGLASRLALAFQRPTVQMLSAVAGEAYRTAKGGDVEGSVYFRADC